jgi:hypothetical protein
MKYVFLLVCIIIVVLPFFPMYKGLPIVFMNIMFWFSLAMYSILDKMDEIIKTIKNK